VRVWNQAQACAGKKTARRMQSAHWQTCPVPKFPRGVIRLCILGNMAITRVFRSGNSQRYEFQRASSLFRRSGDSCAAGMKSCSGAAAESGGAFELLGGFPAIFSGPA